MIASFDIGIKNMAICIFQQKQKENQEQKETTILEWKVLNLMNSISNKEEKKEGQNDENSNKCSCVMTPKKLKKTKKTEKTEKQKEPPTICNKPAKFKDISNNTYCNKHAKQINQTELFLFPAEVIKPTALKKMNITDLQELCKKYGKTPININTKGGCVETLQTHFQEKSLIPIKTKKVKSSEIDLVTIGRNMMMALDEIPMLCLATHVIIENQISPIANRM